jgi:predicted transposase YbfD/YdcC
MKEFIHSSSIMMHFSLLPDPRKARNQLYSLHDIISTSILAMLCGQDDYMGFSLWTQMNLDWLQSVNICKYGAPSHDTYERFFAFLNPHSFRTCFMQWTQSIAQAFGGSSIAIDGKTLCGSGNKAIDPIHMVSAFASEQSLVLGHLKCSGKGKELETIQSLLAILNIKGTVVTIDAAGCHKIVVEQICSQGGDYVIALKGNQGDLHAEGHNFFKQAQDVTPEEAGCDYWRSEERTRGRSEIREVWATEKLDWLPQYQIWKKLRSLICVKVQKKSQERNSCEIRYFISSLPANAERLAKEVRNHWSIENKLHWQLDVNFREDLSRVRKGNGAENLSIVRRSTLNLLQKDKTSKVSLRKRRFIASCRKDYLLALIT